MPKLTERYLEFDEIREFLLGSGFSPSFAAAKALLSQIQVVGAPTEWFNENTPSGKVYPKGMQGVELVGVSLVDDSGTITPDLYAAALRLKIQTTDIAFFRGSGAQPQQIIFPSPLFTVPGGIYTKIRFEYRLAPAGLEPGVTDHGYDRGTDWDASAAPVKLYIGQSSLAANKYHVSILDTLDDSGTSFEAFERGSRLDVTQSGVVNQAPITAAGRNVYVGDDLVDGGEFISGAVGTDTERFMTDPYLGEVYMRFSSLGMQLGTIDVDGIKKAGHTKFTVEFDTADLATDSTELIGAQALLQATNAVDAHDFGGERKDPQQVLEFPRKGQSAVPPNILKAVAQEALARMQYSNTDILERKELGLTSQVVTGDGYTNLRSKSGFGAGSRHFVGGEGTAEDSLSAGQSVSRTLGARKRAERNNFASSPLISRTAYGLIRPFLRGVAGGGAYNIGARAPVATSGAGGSSGGSTPDPVDANDPLAFVGVAIDADGDLVLTRRNGETAEVDLPTAGGGTGLTIDAIPGLFVGPADLTKNYRLGDVFEFEGGLFQMTAAGRLPSTWSDSTWKSLVKTSATPTSIVLQLTLTEPEITALATVGIVKFTDLDDTPASLQNNGGKLVAVKADATALELIDKPAAGKDSFIDLDDTPGQFTGNDGKYLAVNADATRLTFVDAPAGGGDSGGDSGGAAMGGGAPKLLFTSPENDRATYWNQFNELEYDLPDGVKWFYISAIYGDQTDTTQPPMLFNIDDLVVMTQGQRIGTGNKPRYGLSSTYSGQTDNLYLAKTSAGRILVAIGQGIRPVLVRLYQAFAGGSGGDSGSSGGSATELVGLAQSAALAANGGVFDYIAKDEFTLRADLLDTGEDDSITLTDDKFIISSNEHQTAHFQELFENRSVVLALSNGNWIRANITTLDGANVLTGGVRVIRFHCGTSAARATIMAAAYEMPVNLYRIDNIRGAKGDDGQPGPPGADGKQGPPGLDGSGATRFRDLIDTPNSFGGQRGLVAAVNSSENGIEFVSAHTAAAPNYQPIFYNKGYKLNPTAAQIQQQTVIPDTLNRLTLNSASTHSQFVLVGTAQMRPPNQPTSTKEIRIELTAENYARVNQFRVHWTIGTLSDEQHGTANVWPDELHSGDSFTKYSIVVPGSDALIVRYDFDPLHSSLNELVFSGNGVIWRVDLIY